MNIDYKKSAETLLKNTNIIKLLSNFGDVHIIGSYAFDLMTEPDIDLIVITSNPQKSSEDAVSVISKLHLFQKIEYGDFQKFPREKRPPFFIFNMRTPCDNEMFEIECWFLPEANEEIKFVEMMNNISSDQKNEILKLKMERKNNGVDKHILSSFEIYKQVLNF